MKDTWYEPLRHKIPNECDMAKSIAAVDHNMDIEAVKDIYFSIKIKYLGDYSESQKEELKDSLHFKLPAGLLVKEEK